MATELLPANLDLDDDQCPDASFFEEADDVVDMINRVTSSNGKDAHLIHDRLKTIVSRLKLVLDRDG